MRWTMGVAIDTIYFDFAKAFDTSSSFVSFTQFSPTCGRMPLPALSLSPGRQPCRPHLVDGRRGCGPSSVAPRSRNQSINQLLFCPIQRKKKHNIIIMNITVRAGETPKKTARQSLT